jgi:hypothetical protein
MLAARTYAKLMDFNLCVFALWHAASTLLICSDQFVTLFCKGIDLHVRKDRPELLQRGCPSCACIQQHPDSPLVGPAPLML